MRAVLAQLWGLAAGAFDFFLTITPGSTLTFNDQQVETSSHTASVSDGEAAYVWSLVSVTGGSAEIVGSNTLATAALRVTAAALNGAIVDARFEVEATVNGITKSAQIRKRHGWTDGA